MQAIPSSALIVVQATLALGVFIELLNRPAAVGQLDQALQRGVRWQITDSKTTSKDRSALAISSQESNVIA
jgi:hypothetical protein